MNLKEVLRLKPLLGFHGSWATYRLQEDIKEKLKSASLFFDKETSVSVYATRGRLPASWSAGLD
jgi:hypothetical protein